MALSTKNARILPSGFVIAIFQELAALLFRLYLSVSGHKTTSHIRGRLGHRQRYVLAANHQSLIDPFVIFALLDIRHRTQLLPLKFMTIPKVYHRPYVKPFAYLLGCFPAHIRDRKHHTYGIEGSIKLLDYGYNICIFPEGTRTTRAASDPKYGIVRILQERPDTKLLLAHIEWLPRRNYWLRPVRITIAPAPEDLDKSDPKAIMEAIYEL